MVYMAVLLAAAPAMAANTFEESFRAGLLALQRSDFQAAEENLSAAAKLAPNDARVWVALARTYWKLNEAQKADQAAAKAESLGGAQPVVLSTLAIFYADSGRTLQAADATAKYSLLAPTDAAARERAESLYFDVVQPLLQQQKFDDAIAVLTKATRQLPESAQLELALGVAFYGMRRFDDAAIAFLRTIGIAPEIERPYQFLGKFLGQIPGRLTEVTEQFVRFETAHPDRALGYLLHGKALNAQSKDPDTARKVLEKAIALDEREPSGHFELGVVLEALQLYSDAAREFVRAAELDPTDSPTHYRLSRVYDRLGKAEEARKEREIHAKLVATQEAAR
jgi:tetratricopeptide (TPR) repeat protein